MQKTKLFCVHIRKEILTSRWIESSLFFQRFNFIWVLSVDDGMCSALKNYTLEKITKCSGKICLSLRDSCANCIGDIGGTKIKTPPGLVSWTVVCVGGSSGKWVWNIFQMRLADGVTFNFFGCRWFLVFNLFFNFRVDSNGFWIIRSN